MDALDPLDAALDPLDSTASPSGDCWCPPSTGSGCADIGDDGETCGPMESVDDPADKPPNPFCCCGYDPDGDAEPDPLPMPGEASWEPALPPPPRHM